jgi:hypothetical protein
MIDDEIYLSRKNNVLSFRVLKFLIDFAVDQVHFTSNNQQEFWIVRRSIGNGTCYSISLKTDCYT